MEEIHRIRFAERRWDFYALFQHAPQDLHMFTNPKLSESSYLGFLKLLLGFPGVSVIRNSPASAGDSRDVGLIPGSRRPPGVGNGNLL